MTGRHHPFLLLTVLVAIGMRAVFGAPCCMDMAGVDGGHHAAHAHHGVAHTDHLGDHTGSSTGLQEDGEESAGDPSANPCCSACSPPLPSNPIEIFARAAPLALPEPTPVRALATRPPYPAYEATGPPALI